MALSYRMATTPTHLLVLTKPGNARAACSGRSSRQRDAVNRRLLDDSRSRAPTGSVGPWRSDYWSPGSASWTSRPRLAARLRLFDAGHNRKTDAHDAHSIAMVAVRTAGLRVLQARW